MKYLQDKIRLEQDPRTGDLIWDAPAAIGKYNCAFIVEEWRNGVKISETVRDMQIEVKDSDNKAPLIKIPNDICVEAGTLINQTITADDTPAKSNRKDPLNLFSTGGVYKQTDASIPDFINPSFATFKVSNPQNPVASGQFSWQTGCTHVRNETYDVLFKVTDVPPTTFVPLVDSKVWKIKVVAPKPKNLKATFQSDTKTIKITWDAYACSALNGVEIIVYRKEGCTNAVVDVCKPSLPAGYVEIGRVPANQNFFEDKDPNIRAGVGYSYRTAAKFIGSNANETFSAASDESCLSFPRLMGVITNVTVDKTDTKIGEITVKWTRPPVNTGIVKGPYEYRVNRATGLNGTAFTQIGTNIPTDLSPTKADTVFVDKNLNTQDNAYRYRIDFYSTINGTLTRYDSTYSASSVRLSANSGQKVVELSWQANVPWKNDNQKHRVYREDRTKKGTFNLIAEVPVTNPSTFRYTDNGSDTFLADGNATIKLSADSSYCYKVETVGTYNDPTVKPDLLYNFSQISCASPKDTVRPCPPSQAINLNPISCDDYVKQESNCSLTSFGNTLNWKTTSDDCGKDLVSYNIYYKRYEDDKFEKIGSVNVPIQTFTHSGLKSYAGYYVIKAVNKYGTESTNSNVISIDNCFSFNLPNVFTPNGDGKNDTFTPLKCPRFVTNVNITFYNRYGSKVYEYNGPNANIEWNGKGTDGSDLPSGTYYYICETTFDVLAKSGASQVLKGWVEILR
jgi:gliding motility-associated-like protein